MCRKHTPFYDADHRLQVQIELAVVKETGVHLAEEREASFPAKK